jgi:anti-sigma regulatory factor (Ser/Thr protein kinase)
MAPIHRDDAATGSDRGASAPGGQDCAAPDMVRDPVASSADVWPLRLRLSADTIAPSLARDQLRHWLMRLGWPPGQREDIVLAVSEAVSNSVEHAYPTDQPADHPGAWIEMHATTTTVGSGPGNPEGEPAHGADGQRQVRVIVRDHGRWRPIPTERENRRRGFPIMRACMDSVTIEPLTDDGRPAGTRVTLVSTLVPTR